MDRINRMDRKPYPVSGRNRINCIAFGEVVCTIESRLCAEYSHQVPSQADGGCRPFHPETAC
jgi:hypothetical protein